MCDPTNPFCRGMPWGCRRYDRQWHRVATPAFVSTAQHLQIRTVSLAFLSARRPLFLRLSLSAHEISQKFCKSRRKYGNIHHKDIRRLTTERKLFWLLSKHCFMFCIKLNTETEALLWVIKKPSRTGESSTLFASEAIVSPPCSEI